MVNKPWSISSLFHQISADGKKWVAGSLAAEQAAGLYYGDGTCDGIGKGY